MTEQELIEQLADKEHASWARWMEYLFSLCEKGTVIGSPGEYIIPEGLIERWQQLIDMPYAELPERLKQSDRDEVAHILPIIQQYTREWQRSEADGT